MRRHLFTAVSLVSLLLCMATLAVWVRSRTGRTEMRGGGSIPFRIDDIIIWGEPLFGQHRILAITSYDGLICCKSMESFSDAPDWPEIEYDRHGIYSFGDFPRLGFEWEAWMRSEEHTSELQSPVH